MIYIEYIDRDRTLPIEIFRVFADQASWTDSEDELVGLFGRTMRMAAYPAYMAFWKCKGMARMDEWEAYFRSDDFHGHLSEQATHRAIHIARGGCYDVLVEAGRVDREALFCVESFSAGTAVTDRALVDHFHARESATGARLDFLLRRIGRLGPDPGCLAVWSFADYVALEPFQRAVADDDLFGATDTGIYRWLGKDIL
jgi:hypothetical protein